MSAGLLSATDERGLQELMGCLHRIADSLHSAPLSRDALMARWGLPEEKTFVRWCDELNLKPFEGRGKHARYRLPAVLRAEQKGEQRNGGAGV